MDNNTLRETLQTAGLHLFSDRRSDSKARAQDCLQGRTHYVDPDTLRYFKSRILGSDVICSDTLFYIIESVSLDAGHTRRGVRAVVFDIFGTTVYRPSMDECHKTRQMAIGKMWAWLDTFDAGAHYMEVLERRAIRLEREANDLRVAVRQIERACEVSE